MPGTALSVFFIYLYIYISLLEREEELVLLLLKANLQSRASSLFYKSSTFSNSYKDEPLLYIKGENTVLIHVENTFFTHIDHEYITRQSLRVQFGFVLIFFKLCCFLMVIK